MLKWSTHPTPPKKTVAMQIIISLCNVSHQCHEMNKNMFSSCLFTPDLVCSFVWHCLPLIQSVWLPIAILCNGRSTCPLITMNFSWFYLQWLFRGQADAAVLFVVIIVIVLSFQVNFTEETFGLFLFLWLQLLLLLCFFSFIKFYGMCELPLRQQAPFYWQHAKIITDVMMWMWFILQENTKILETLRVSSFNSTCWELCLFNNNPSKLLM